LCPIFQPSQVEFLDDSSTVGDHRTKRIKVIPAYGIVPK
jgi:hypothetical protein